MSDDQPRSPPPAVPAAPKARRRWLTAGLLMLVFAPQLFFSGLVDTSDNNNDPARGRLGPIPLLALVVTLWGVASVAVAIYPRFSLRTLLLIMMVAALLAGLWSASPDLFLALAMLLETLALLVAMAFVLSGFTIWLVKNPNVPQSPPDPSLPQKR